MQVHDELVLEVAKPAIDEVRGKVVELMCGAAELAVALKVDTRNRRELGRRALESCRDLELVSNVPI